MSRVTLTAAAAALTLALAPAARAGIADSPLPVLVAGKTTLHLYSVPSVIRGAGLETFFGCTSTDTAAMQVGVEIFGGAGGSPVNDAVATSASVGPGATVLFATGAAVWTGIDSDVGGVIGHSSARILATSKKLTCTTFVADAGNAPPTTSWQLTIIRKLKQKAAN